MAIAQDFAYLRPQTLDEVVAALAEHGEAARVLAGGTDLVGWMRDDLVSPGVVVDIKRVDGLGEIRFEDDRLWIGALVTFSGLLRSDVVRERFPLLCEMAGVVASIGIRNRATVVGNICSAVPCCDAGPVLQAYDAQVRVIGPQGERSVEASEWFTGPRQTALQSGEVAVGVEVPLPANGHGGAYVKLARYAGEDLAQASVAVIALAGPKYRIAFGAVAPTPVRARRIESHLAGKPLDRRLVAAAKELVPEEIAPISDVRATAEYRQRMCAVMLERGLWAATARLREDGPPYGERLI